ncbi:glycosyltransferase family 4 protein [Asticcacaulis sp. AC402]|uniref:glycosyltransferase family 4 protein n=1 Tax=Asticcacaulis sp. AC402 TaxID=1282361 RepID=UPI0003C3E406|nr:glycosyltransferase family 4 protein [Asticcacaulis sp. AC402]ESQ77708.1 glycosyl transferase family 1 [Asticcacaulis sp. AC402]
MKALFVHRNMPGQFKHISRYLAERGHQVAFITRRDDRELKGVVRLTYPAPREVKKDTHPYLRSVEDAVLHGQAVVRVCQQLASKQFIPDLMVGHPGWGETLFLKDIYPTSPLISYSEYFFEPDGPMTTFDPARPQTLNGACHLRVSNSHLQIAQSIADLGWSAMDWQKSTYPAWARDRIRTIFDGIDTEHVKQKPDASITLDNGRVLTKADEVITYVARNLEPVRGFPTFMRALPAILKGRPKATVLVMGGDEVSYGVGGSKTKWREKMLEEVELPEGRVHFLGQRTYGEYLSVLSVSSLHLYLTYPFVLSWSLMEALSMGCFIVASNTAPVLEVMRDKENGLFTDFFDPAKVADDVLAAMEYPDKQRLRDNARATIVDSYSLPLCLEKQLGLFREATGIDW